MVEDLRRWVEHCSHLLNHDVPTSAVPTGDFQTPYSIDCLAPTEAQVEAVLYRLKLKKAPGKMEIYKAYTASLLGPLCRLMPSIRPSEECPSDRCYDQF